MEAQECCIRIRLYTLSCALQPTISFNAERFPKGFPENNAAGCPSLFKNGLASAELRRLFPNKRITSTTFTAGCSKPRNG